MQEDDYTEDEMNEAMGIEAEEPIEPTEEPIEPTEEPQKDDDPLAHIPEEDRKYAKGWVEGGEKALEWFISDGKMIEQLQQVKANQKKSDEDHKKRTNRLIEFHEMQQKSLRVSIEAEMADAVNMSDLDGVNKAREKLNDLDRLAEPEPQEVDTAPLDSWNAANPWIEEQSPKSAYAKQVFQTQLNTNGGDFEAALKTVDAELEKHYPSQPERQKAPKTTTSRTTPGKQGAPAKLRWSDLTRDEEAMFKGMPDAWTQEEFLQTVQDSRGGE